MKSTQTTKRDANIELLRMLMGMAVVVLHYNFLPSGGGATDYAVGVNHYILYFLEAVCIVAVDVFMLISGYFSSSKKTVNIIKPIRLLLQLIIFDVVIFLLNCFLPWGDTDFSLRGLVAAFIPANYYVILYIVVMLLSPYLNELINRMDQKNLTRFIVLLSAVFLIYPTLVDIAELVGGGTLSGLSTVSMNGSGSGYTAVNFVVCYCIGAYLRRLDLEKIAVWKPLVIWLVCLGVTTVVSLKFSSISWMYCNPVVVLEGASLLILFAKMKIKSRLILALAPAAFSCYLIHGSILHYIDFKFMASANPGAMLGILFATVIVIYGFSWIIHKIWNILTNPIFSKWEKSVNAGWTIGIK